jgi:electron transfer flavoprotein beta subunit
MPSPLKIMVCVKRVIDPNVKVNVRSDGGGMQLTGLRTVLNPFDEVAVEEAVRLREKGLASEVVAVSVGPAECREVLRTAMAMGADRSVLVDCGDDPEPLAAARYLAAVVRAQEPDLVIAGKQSTDHDYGQTPGMLAALLGWPQALQASALERTEEGVRVTCELDRGTEVVNLPLPALVSADLRLNEPRYASLPAVMKAKKKPIEHVEVASLAIEGPAVPHLQVLGASAPPTRGAGKRVHDAAELADIIKAAVSVI